MKENCRYNNFKDALAKAKELHDRGTPATVRRNNDQFVVYLQDSHRKASTDGDTTSIRVGKFIATGAIVVFDDAVKIGNSKNVYGYAVRRNIMREFKREQLASVEIIEGRQRDEAIKRYFAWKKVGLEAFICSEKEELETAIRIAIGKHKKRLAKLGRPNLGVNLNTSKVHRMTHCFSCKAPLDSDLDVECRACRWLICSCGACGCVYEEEHS